MTCGSESCRHLRCTVTSVSNVCLTNKKKIEEKLKTLENELKSLLQRPRDELRWEVIKVVWLEISEISEAKPEDYGLLEVALEMADYVFLEIYSICLE